MHHIVAFGAIDWNIVKRIVIPVSADSVHGSDPEPAGLVAQKTLDLIVRQTGVVVAAAEILVVLVGVEAVQSTEGAEPDVATAVLSYGGNPVVRQAGGSDSLGCGLCKGGDAAD